MTRKEEIIAEQSRVRMFFYEFVEYPAHLQTLSDRHVHKIAQANSPKELCVIPEPAFNKGLLAVSLRIVEVCQLL
jgi:hypothetical protein